MAATSYVAEPNILSNLVAFRMKEYIVMRTVLKVIVCLPSYFSCQ